MLRPYQTLTQVSAPIGNRQICFIHRPIAAHIH